MAIDWKAFFDPRLAFARPIKTLGIASALFGVFKAAPDPNNRWLAFGLLLLCLSFASQKFRRILYQSDIIDVGEKTPWIFSLAALIQFLAFSVFSRAFLLLCLHQWGMTPRLDGYLSAWAHSHPQL
jgi:hypothetical protein